MPCRVGVTVDPVRRREEWEALVVNLRDWNVIGIAPTWKRAMVLAAEYAKKTTRLADPGEVGEVEEACPWHIYSFSYTRER